MSEIRQAEIGKVVTNNMKSCSLCNKGNCNNIKFRTTLNNFGDVYYCGNTSKVISYKKLENA